MLNQPSLVFLGNPTAVREQLSRSQLIVDSLSLLNLAESMLATPVGARRRKGKKAGPATQVLSAKRDRDDEAEQQSASTSDFESETEMEEAAAPRRVTHKQVSFEHTEM